jgi:hypothetical protein
LFLSLWVTARASYSVYTAIITGDGGTATNASGEVTVFVSDPSATGGMYTVFAVGSVSGLEADLSNVTCLASTLACGLHIHDAESFAFIGNASLWYPNKYTSTGSAGELAINYILDLDSGDMGGRLFAIHDSAGSPGAGGILVQETSDVWSVATAEIDSSGVDGSATLFTDGTVVTGAGKVSGLSADVTDCSATNGCGAHVHSGTSCDSTSGQGGHHYNTEEDPWTTTGYTSTDSDGDARFVFSVDSEGVDIDGRTFVIHMDDGTRASCGLISSAPTPAPTLMPTMAPTPTPMPTMAPTPTPMPTAFGSTSKSVCKFSVTAMIIHFVLGC